MALEYLQKREQTMRILVVAVMCLWSSFAFAQNVASASYYLPGCKAYNEKGEPPVPVALRMTKCLGVIESLMILGLSKKLSQDSQLCFPDGVTANQVAATVAQYVEQHPARQRETFVPLALEAMRATWPCK
ncbi:MAG TPA: Rap1a/Tai family immunity protein [Methyloceanibacter sp.]|jgi:hypothetical protein|nr:Rap1a/Tai family immunity protein [Methyloceanibacter sp.]